MECPHCKKDVVMFQADHGKGKKQAIYACPHPFCRKEFNYSLASIKGEVLVSLDYVCQSKGMAKNHEGSLPPVNGKALKPFWYPNDKLYLPSGKPFVTKRRFDTISDLFTERNLYALSVLFHQIEVLKDGPIKDVLLFTFTSCLGQVSKLVPYEEEGGGLGWIIHNYLVFPVHRELNVWHSFQSRFQRIVAGKEYVGKRRLKMMPSEAEKI